MWDERFSSAQFVFGTDPADFLQAQAGRLPARQRVLVIADGEGRNGVYLAEQGHEVVSMDASPVGLAKARGLAAERGVTVEWHEGDLLTWEWEPDGFDAIVGIFFQFLTPEQRPDVFAGMIRTVRPGGLVLIHGYLPEQIELATGGPPQRSHMYTEALLREHFGHLEIERLESYEAELHEGTGHVGQSALIDLVARKAPAGSEQ